MPENQEKNGSQKDGDLDLQRKAQKLLDDFTDDQSIHVIGERVNGDRGLEEAKQF